MNCAVIGCGAIGGLFLTYLSEAGVRVKGIVKEYQKEILSEEGFLLEGSRGNRRCEVDVGTHLNEPVDLAIVSTKIDDIKEALSVNKHSLEGAVVLTTQNGVRAEYLLKQYFSPEQIVTGIVMFGATYYPPNRIVHNFEGDLIVGSLFAREIIHFEEVMGVLREAFHVVSIPNIKGAKYLKVFLNLNNCLPAALGISMQEAFSDLEIARLAIQLNKEAYGVVARSNIQIESLPTYPKERLQKLIFMDTEQAAHIFSNVMTSLSKEPLYGSLLQSIKRGRKSEIDYINGEIVTLAQQQALDAPLNKKIVEMVHRVENEGKFLAKEELLCIFNNESKRRV